MVSEADQRARWIEAETVALKRMGLSFDMIADQVARVARGEAQAIVTLPAGVALPRDFVTSRQTCHKAFAQRSSANRRSRSTNCASSTTPALRKCS